MASRIDIDLLRLKYGAMIKDDLSQFLHMTEPYSAIHTCTKSQLVVRAIEADIRQHLALSLSQSEIGRFVVNNCHSDRALHWANQQREGCIQELEKLGYRRSHTKSLKLWELVNKIVRMEQQATTTVTAEALAVPTARRMTLHSSRWAPSPRSTRVSEAPQHTTLTPRSQIASRSALPTELEQAPTSLPNPPRSAPELASAPPSPPIQRVPSVSLLSPSSPRASTVPSTTNDSERRRVEAIYEIRSDPSIHSETSTYTNDLSELSSRTSFASPPASIASSHFSASLTSISDFSPFFGEDLFSHGLPAMEPMTSSRSDPMMYELDCVNSQRVLVPTRSSSEMVEAETNTARRQSRNVAKTSIAELELSPISLPSPISYTRPATIRYPVIPQSQSEVHKFNSNSDSFYNHSKVMVNELEELSNNSGSSCQRSQVRRLSSSGQGLAQSRWAHVCTYSARRPSAPHPWPSQGILLRQEPSLPSSTESRQVQSEPTLRSDDRKQSDPRHQSADLASTETRITEEGEGSRIDVAATAPRVSKMARRTWAEIRAGRS